MASRLGFRVGDVIEQVNKTKVSRIGDVQQVVADQPSRWRIKLRRNGKRLKMEFRS